MTPLLHPIHGTVVQNTGPIIHRMPWMLVRGGTILAYAWSREQAEGGAGPAGTFRGARVVPQPTVGQP